MKIFLTLLLSIFISTTLMADKKKNKEEVDYVALAAILLKDGYINRADEALKSVDTNSTELDKVRYYTINGLVKSKQGLYQESNDNFYKSIENGQLEKSVYIYIAQNSFKLKNYEEAISALDNADEIVITKPKLMALKADCYFKSTKHNESLVVLKEVNRLFPDYFDAYKQRFYYLMALNLYKSALSDAKIYLENAKANEKVTISFINALRRAKESDKAIRLAEEANLRYPTNAKLIVILAHLYIDKEMIQAAADLFNKASIYDKKYIKESSEMFRRAKEYVQALYKNSQILDTKEKYKQKIAIYLEFENYEKVISTESALKRNGLLEDENMVYALAYAFYMSNEFEISEYYLKKLTRSDLFKKALELRKNMQKCKNNQWECRL